MAHVAISSRLRSAAARVRALPHSIDVSLLTDRRAPRGGLTLGGMKGSFERFSAWRLAPKPAASARAERDDDARRRWEGEGGNSGIPAARIKPTHGALARVIPRRPWVR